MAKVLPFRSIRPVKELAFRTAALPYDVYNREEAKKEALKDKLSFLNIDRPESQFDDSVDMYDEMVYKKAKELLDSQISEGLYKTDAEKYYYLYELTAGGRSQTGIVAVSSIDDYVNNVIKKHENTREEKEQDRIRHVDVCNAQTGPIFLAYRAKKEIDIIVEKVKQTKAEYDFTTDDGIMHRVWIVNEAEDIANLIKAFGNTDSIYIADGHHRAASAVKVGLKRRKENPEYDGTEEFNYFLSILFPDDQLEIMDYNRVVKDLNGFSKEEFLNLASCKFTIVKQQSCESKGGKTSSFGKPNKRGMFGMYLDGEWYMLTAKQEILSDDPVDGLDVSILQNNLLKPILGINDPRKDKRIDFIGGVRGLEELEKRCNNDMRVAFAMYPTSMAQLFAVADAGRLMPPKSTWFEPKPRSGLFIHSLA